ncbi:MAG: FRG domain-containing protein, partial [bacterium]
MQMLSNNEIVVSSWSELMDRLFDGSWDPKIQRHRPPYTYRGLSDARYQLQTSLMRLGGNYHEVEKHLLRNFRKYAHRNAVEFDSIWHWLPLAAHHGLPTRLLDWTHSPLIAAHFATCEVEKFDVDGVVWCVNFVEVNQLLPEKLKMIIAKEGALELNIEMLNEGAESL